MPMIRTTRPGRGRCAAALFICALAAGDVRAQDAARLTASLQAIAAGNGSDGRREAILASLETVGVEPELRAFGAGPAAGTNIIVTIPGTDARTIVVGAHYDSVPAGRGAVDNGAACAALIELIAAFRASPLTRFTLIFVFFDREESGLLGSRAYFADTRPAYAVNVDIFAYGDTLFSTTSAPDGALHRALRTAASSSGLAVRDLPPARYPGSDHQSMIAAGIETVGLALVEAADVDGIEAIGPQGLTPGKGPRTISIIHTPRDTMAEVRVEEIVRAIPVVERMVRTLERND